MKESIQLAANTGHLGIRELTLPQERIRATLDLELKTKLITALNARDIEQVTGTVPSSCEAAYQLPRTKVVCTHVNGESFLGYPVHRVRQTATFGTDELVKEILATPSLDWAPLQISVFNSGRLVEQRKAVLVQEVEPNSSLFVVPADYNVLSAPSQMISGALKARKQTYDPEKLSRLDKAFESRQKAPNK